MSRETELKQAVYAAGLPRLHRGIYEDLFRRAKWGTGEILPQFQPRSLADLAKWCDISEATLKRGLNHLERHGWIERRRSASPGRGHRTTYQLLLGTGCDCKPADRPKPASDAERARRYRARKKAAQSAVTDAPQKGAHVPVTADAKGAHSERDSPAKGAQRDVTKGLASRDDAAGQAPFSAIESPMRRGTGKPVLCDSCGTLMDPVLISAGYRTHPLCEPYAGPEGPAVEREFAEAFVGAFSDPGRAAA